jgi:hypothetical protein
MLAAEQERRAYVKSRHSEVLMAQIRRTHRSVEFKHQNISAVLEEMGLPWIPGYKPKRNYQNAIFGAIDRYLTEHPQILEGKAPSQSLPAQPGQILVTPPTLQIDEETPVGLQRLVRKYDPVARDYRNRALGKAGEEFVVAFEQRQLADCGRSDLVAKVRWVSAVDGDGAGYDVHSFDPSGHDRLLEVKTTNGSARTPFFVTRNERSLAEERPAEWRIYRVHLFSQTPRIFVIAPPLESSIHLRPETWRASF